MSKTCSEGCRHLIWGQVVQRLGASLLGSWGSCFWPKWTIRLGRGRISYRQKTAFSSPNGRKNSRKGNPSPNRKSRLKLFFQWFSLNLGSGHKKTAKRHHIFCQRCDFEMPQAMSTGLRGGFLKPLGISSVPLGLPWNGLERLSRPPGRSSFMAGAHCFWPGL